MKKIALLWFLIFCGQAFAADYSGAVPEGCYRTQWQSKWSLDTQLTCNSGYGLKSIAFKHRGGENGTHEESFQLMCCQNSNVKSGLWWENDFHSNWDLQTASYVNNFATMVGIRFKHRAGENGTYQQEYRIATSGLKTNHTACSWTPFGSKWSLETEFMCPSNKIINGIQFKHSHGENGTHQESISVMCCR